MANDLRVLLSPTYSDDYLDRASDRGAVKGDLANLARRLKRAMGDAVPYAFMPEVQPRRSERMGFEVYNGMVLVPVLPRSVLLALKDSWSFGGGGGYRGFDWQRWDSPRGASGYASKALHAYASKGLGSAGRGEQAYSVAQGFQPARVEVEVPDPHNSAVEAARSWAGSSGVEVVSAFDLRDSERGGDACWLAWEAA